jgi:4a-hydroxytetrahydrobiopterin dehydratase
MGLLDRERIAELLVPRAGWALDGGSIRRSFPCGDFDGSIRFVNAVAAEANAQDHHPDIAISWDKVTLTLSSHDAGGLTERDFKLADSIDALAPG